MIDKYETTFQLRKARFIKNYIKNRDNFSAEISVNVKQWRSNLHLEVRNKYLPTYPSFLKMTNTKLSLFS